MAGRSNKAGGEAGSVGRPVGESIRTIEASEIDGWVRCMATGFLTHPSDGEGQYRLTDMDLDRTWGAFDDGSVVGTLRSFATVLTVPGPTELDAAALTNVTVAPTHRRRGLLTEMITNDLRASAARGEAIGILIASEYPIYGRFGYGAAVDGATYRVNTPMARFLRDVPGRVELVDPSTLRRVGPPVYDRVRSEQPGAIGRNDRWWDRSLGQDQAPGPPPAKGYAAVYRAPTGEVEGYLRYRAAQEWDHMRPKGTLSVAELQATTPDAYLGLWRYCCEVDLVTSVEAGDRSADEPLRWLLHDGRAVRQTGRFDFVWVRVLDVAAALSARRYPVEDHLVIEVMDPVGITGGRFALGGGPTGATCRATESAADLTLPVDALGSIYLGGVSLLDLARAGRVDEHRPGALARADTMFRSPVIPWCATWF